MNKHKSYNKYAGSIFIVLFLLFIHILNAQERPSIWGIAKMTFYISDIKIAREFYGSFLGFEEAFSYGSELGGIVSFKINDRQFVEFIENRNIGERSRLVSVSFETAHPEQMRQYLKSKGVEVPRKTIIDGAGNEIFLVHDNSGVPVEFIDLRPEGLHRKSKGKFLSESRISKRIHHAGLYCVEVIDDDPFYVGILGFKELWRFPADRKEKIVMNYLHIPDCVENIEHYPSKNINISHPCFLVEDMQETIYTLKERKGNNELGEPMVGKGNRWLMNIKNLGGLRVEFTEAHIVR